MNDLRGIERNLQNAVVSCNERCLYNSAKWSVKSYERKFAKTDNMKGG